MAPAEHVLGPAVVPAIAQECDGRQRPCKLQEFLPEDPEEVLTWHPNQTCAALVQYVASKVIERQGSKRSRRLTVKLNYILRVVQLWQQNGMQDKTDREMRFHDLMRNIPHKPNSLDLDKLQVSSN